MNNSEINNIKEVLLAPDNENIVAGNNIAFLQIFSVVSNGKAYSILRPLRPVEGCQKNEAFVYLVDKTKLTRVKSKKIIKEVFELYYQALRGETVDAEFACVKMRGETYKPYGIESLENVRKNTIVIQKYIFCQKLLRAFRARIKGQDAAIVKLVEMLCTDQISTERGPKAVISMFGAPAVGKTETTELLNDLQGEGGYLYINCTLFIEKENVFILSGIHRSYKEATPGQIALRLLKTPYGSIIFFDEFDHAHSSAKFLLYEALDKGRLYDAFLKMDVDLSQSILVFASNAAASIYQRPGAYNLADTPKEVIIQALRREKDREGKPLFTEAILSRLSSGLVIMMNNLRPLDVKEIMVDAINREVETIKLNEGISFQVNAEQLAELLIFQNSHHLDLRSMKKQMSDFFKTQLVFGINMIGETHPHSYVEEIVCHLDWTVGQDHKVDKLLLYPKKPKILLFGNSRATKAIHTLACAEIVEGKMEDIDSYLAPKSGFEMVLIDATESLSKARKYFDTIKERSDLPLYVFSTNPIGMANLLYFLKKGIDDYYVPTSSLSFQHWLEKVASAISFTAVCHRLMRQRKAIDFAEVYSFDEQTKQLHVYADFAVKDVFERSENGKIISWDQDTRRKIATHEAGHALVGLALDRPVDYVTIESRGDALGCVRMDNSGVYAYTARELRDIICQALSGRAAEEMIYGEVTTGALQDLQQATKLASEMVCVYGMHDSLIVTENTAERKQDIEKVLQDEYSRAKQILSERKNTLERIASALCASNSLNREELERTIMYDDNEQ